MMNIHTSTWRFTVRFLLIFALKCFPLLSASFSSKVECQGYLTVEPARVFLLGSNLTLYCHLTRDGCSSRNRLLLMMDGGPWPPEERINCTTARFRLTNVRSPESVVRCVEHMPGFTQTVCGLVLHGGLPPDKPTGVICEASRDSGQLDCWWEKGQVTHLSTTYNISLTSADGTQVHNVRVQSNRFTVPLALLGEDDHYQLTIAAYNPLGASQSDPVRVCVKDVVVPETPLIVHIEFGNDSSTATVRCRRPESSEQLSYHARLGTENSSFWLHGNGTDMVRVEGLNALTEYEVQARACYIVQVGGLSTEPASTTRFSPTSEVISSQRLRCSKWSPAIRRVSPGKGPSQELQVWTILGHQDSSGLQNVTVLWKPPPPEEYSGGLQRYEILLGHAENKVVTCPPAGSQCVIQVSPDVQTLRVSAVTSYGRSPPAAVYLRPSGVPGPALIRPRPAGNGTVVLSWSWPPSGPAGSGVAEGLVGYITEWTSGPAEIRWSKESRDQNTTIIRGLNAGVRYNFSVYTVTTTGISEPSSALAYSEEQIPLSGPKVSVMDHPVGRILIQWEELPVVWRRGFITNYTVYVRTSSSSNREHRISVSGSSPRRVWLDCPEHRVLLGLSASNSAGEGPKGDMVSSQPTDTKVGLVIALVLTTTLFSVAVAILMCWSSVRKRLKQAYISWGPSWLVEHLPQPEDSKANALLKWDVQIPTEPSCTTAHSDPPLSPIEEIPREDREDTNLLTTQLGPLQAQGLWPRLTAPTEGPVESLSYKPHAPCMQEDEEERGQGGGGGEQRDIPYTPACEQGGGCSAMLGEFPRMRLFCGVDGDLPNGLSLGFNESSGSHIQHPL